MFKKMFYIVIAFAITLAACSPSPTATPAPTQTARVEVVMQVVEVTAHPPAATEPAATEQPVQGLPAGDSAVTVDFFQAWNVNTGVDSATVDLANHDVFTTTVEYQLPNGELRTISLPEAGHILGHPGKLNEEWNPLNQDGITHQPPANWRCSEGNFAAFSMGYGTLKILDAVFRFDGDGNSNWHGYIRCRNSGEGDLNFDLEFLDYQPGNVELDSIDGADPGGFVSLGFAMQRAYTSHVHGAGNCGNGSDQSCDWLYMFLYDVNTEALVILRQFGPEGTWELLYSNY